MSEAAGRSQTGLEKAGMSGSSELGLAGIGCGGEGQEARGKARSGRPAHDSPPERVRECGLSPGVTGSHRRLLSRHVAPSDGHVCVEGHGEEEAGGPGSSHEWGGATVLQREERLTDVPTQTLPLPLCDPCGRASQRARSRASSALLRETSSSWTTTQASRS